MENFETLKKVLMDKGVKEDSIKMEATLTDLGLDSLDTVECLMDIEDKLNIEFANHELFNVKTIKDVIDLIDSKIK